MEDKLQLISMVIFLVVVFGLVIWWNVAQWGECRDAGFSIFYCLKHIS